MQFVKFFVAFNARGAKSAVVLPHRKGRDGGKWSRDGGKRNGFLSPDATAVRSLVLSWQVPGKGGLVAMQKVTAEAQLIWRRVQQLAQ